MSEAQVAPAPVRPSRPGAEVLWATEPNSAGTFLTYEAASAPNELIEFVNAVDSGGAVRQLVGAIDILALNAVHPARKGQRKTTHNMLWDSNDTTSVWVCRGADYTHKHGPTCVEVWINEVGTPPTINRFMPYHEALNKFPPVIGSHALLLPAWDYVLPYEEQKQSAITAPAPVPAATKFTGVPCCDHQRVGKTYMVVGTIHKCRHGTWVLTNGNDAKGYSVISIDASGWLKVGGEEGALCVTPPVLTTDQDALLSASVPLREILAEIHADDGTYVADHGWLKGAQDAVVKLRKWPEHRASRLADANAAEQAGRVAGTEIAREAQGHGNTHVENLALDLEQQIDDTFQIASNAAMMTRASELKVAVLQAQLLQRVGWKSFMKRAALAGALTWAAWMTISVSAAAVSGFVAGVLAEVGKNAIY